MTANALEVRDLSCTVGNRTLFKSLGFSLDSGRWVMLTGANGTGKSTLLRILAGLVAPTGGEVCWQGAPRGAHDPDWHASFVYQGHSSGWKDQLSTRENLAMQAWLDMPDSASAQREQAVDRSIERLGLGRQRHLPFARLSAGQRRRLGLARLPMSSRPLWLLDEPTTALDAAGQQLFASILEEHLQGGGCAIVATHLELPTASPAQPLRLGADGA